MSIEFIRDEFLEGKKQELDKIDKVLSKKPVRRDRNALFLRRFTLALMGQYKTNKHLHRKNREIEELNKEIVEESRKLVMPQRIINIPQRPVRRVMPARTIPQGVIKRQIPHFHLEAPTPRGLQAPSPQQRAMPNIPSDIPLPQTPLNVPEPMKSFKKQEKEFKVPKPV